MEEKIYLNDNAEQLNYKWEVKSCFSGEDCWCRIIETVNKNLFFKRKYSDDEEYEQLATGVIDSGAINKKLADYIVKLHNENLNKNNII